MDPNIYFKLPQNQDNFDINLNLDITSSPGTLEPSVNLVWHNGKLIPEEVKSGFWDTTMDVLKEAAYAAVFADAKDTELSPTAEYWAKFAGNVARDIALTVAGYGVVDLIGRSVTALNWITKASILPAAARGAAAGAVKTAIEDIFTEKDATDYLINMAQYGGGDLARSAVGALLKNVKIPGALKELLEYTADVTGGALTALAVHGDIDQTFSEIIAPQAVAMGVVDLLFYGIKAGKIQNLNKLQEEIIVSTKTDLEAGRITPDEAVKRISKVMESAQLNPEELINAFKEDITKTGADLLGVKQETPKVTEAEAEKAIEKLAQPEVKKPEVKTPINTTRITTDPVTVEFILDTAKKLESETKTKITFEETKSKAKMDVDEAARFFGAEAGEIKRIKELVETLPEDITKAREFLVTTGNLLRKTAQDIQTKLQKGEDITADKLTFMKLYTLHETMLKDVLHISNKVAQALAVHRIEVDGKSYDVDEAFKILNKLDYETEAVVKAVEDIDDKTFQSMVNNIAKMEDVADINKYVKGTSVFDNLLKAIVEYRTTNLLSNLWTHARNITAQTARTIFDTAKDYLAATYNLAFRKGAPDATTFRQATARLIGNLTGISKAWFRPLVGVKDVYGILHNKPDATIVDVLFQLIKNPKEFEKLAQITNLGMTKAQAESLTGAITAENLLGTFAHANSVLEFLGKTVDYFGALQRLSSYGLLQLGDKPFEYGGYLGQLNYNIAKLQDLGQLSKAEAKELYQQVLNYRKAKILEPVLKRVAIDNGAKNVQEVNQFVQNKLKEMGVTWDPDKLDMIQKLDEDAYFHANDVTWKTPLETDVLKSFNQLINKHPTLKLLIPFMKTPSKIIEYWAESSGFNMKKTYQIFKYGTPEQKVQHVAALTLSWLTYFAAWEMYQNGLLTPSPRDEAERRAMQEAGLQPNAIKVGDKWVNINTLDPWPALWFSTAANLTRALQEIETADDEEQLTKTISGFIWATTESILSKTFFTSISDLVYALQGQGVESFVRRFGQSFKPAYGLQNFKEQTFAQYLMETNLKLSEAKPKLDSYGKPIRPYKIIAGLRVSEQTDSPIRKEIVRLGINLPLIQQQIMGVKLTDEQYYRLKEILGEIKRGGKDIEDVLNDTISKPNYQKLPQEAKRQVILQIYKAFVDEAKAKLLQEYPELKLKIAQEKTQPKQEPQYPDVFESSWQNFFENTLPNLKEAK